jgi:hypothetical protein
MNKRKAVRAIVLLAAFRFAPFRPSPLSLP